MAKAPSVEEKVEDWCKKQICTGYFIKTEPINSEIDNAFKKAPSKSGGDGKNFPDIKYLITTSDGRFIPVMIECKGSKGDFIKEKDGEILNNDKDGNPNYSTIQKYAVNGAVHYARAILDYTESYKEVVAIGVNGYMVNGNLIKEIGAYFLSKENLFVPKKIDDFSDLSFLQEQNQRKFVEQLDDLKLTPEEIEQKKNKLEDEIEIRLKRLNQVMFDDLQIVAESRVKLIAGMIMAGLGVANVSAGLKLEDLKGELGRRSNDGQKIIDKIEDFLKSKNLPEEKQDVIIDELSIVFKNKALYEPYNGESKLKKIFSIVKNNILPFLSADLHNIDFTGRLFNVLNAWVKVPDGGENDVVLTPRSVTELMVKLTQVNKDSYVWDYATGSAGFLISAMHTMINDAKKKIKSPNDQNLKIATIKAEQLLGIEKLPEIYILAVLNMILMGDGSSNIIHGDSLKFNGKYQQGKRKNENFPADIFLLNPPYSAPGKGMNFVEFALSKMQHGKAAILIQENAGSGKQGDGYPKKILENNTLLASIHMPPDLFIGKSSVQTAIYVFDVGIPHDPEKTVKFIDFSNDGYARQNRKKSSQSVNLKDSDHAKERYEEIVNLVVRGKGKDDKNLNFYKDCYVEDYISLDGNDWTYSQHKPVNPMPTFNDLLKVVKDFIIWETSSFLEIENNQEIVEFCLWEPLSTKEQKCLNEIKNGSARIQLFRLGDLFDIHPTKAYRMINDDLFKYNGSIPVVANSSSGNGIGGWIGLDATEKGNKIIFSDTTTSDAIFYQPFDFVGYPHVQGLYAKNCDSWKENSLLFLVATFKKCASNRFDYTNKFGRDIAANMNVSLPVLDTGSIDFDYMDNLISAIKKIAIQPIMRWLNLSNDCILDKQNAKMQKVSYNGLSFAIDNSIAADIEIPTQNEKG